MTNERKSEHAGHGILGLPLAGRTDGELRRQYGDLLRDLSAGIRAEFGRPRTADLVVAAIRAAGRTAFEVLERAAGVAVDALTGGRGLQPAFATRSATFGGGGSAGGAGVARVAASKEGRGARLRVTLEGTGKGPDLRVAMEDGSGKRLAPMTLTITDGESGERLLDGVRYGSGEVVLHGVERGEYEMSASSGEATGEFTLKVR